MPPVNKKLTPTLLSKSAAAGTDCLTLYQGVRDRTGTDKIAISIKGATLHSFGHSTHTQLIHLPRESKPISDFCPSGYEHYEVSVEVKYDHLDPNTLMTRGEFYIELLDAWNGFFNALPVGQQEFMGKAIQLLNSTYETKELANLDYLGANYENHPQSQPA